MSHVARGKFCAKSSGFRLVYPMIGNEQRIVFRLKKAFGKGRENSISLSAGLSYFPFFFLSPQRYMPYDDVNENGRKNNTQRCKAYPKPLVKIAKSISNMIFTWKKSDFRDVFFIRTNAIKRQTKSMDAINKKRKNHLSFWMEIKLETSFEIMSSCRPLIEARKTCKLRLKMESIKPFPWKTSLKSNFTLFRTKKENNFYRCERKLLHCALQVCRIQGRQRVESHAILRR